MLLSISLRHSSSDVSGLTVTTFVVMHAFDGRVRRIAPVGHRPQDDVAIGDHAD
jgi:hypothetical protein